MGVADPSVVGDAGNVFGTEGHNRGPKIRLSEHIRDSQKPDKPVKPAPVPVKPAPGKPLPGVPRLRIREDDTVS